MRQQHIVRWTVHYRGAIPGRQGSRVVGRDEAMGPSSSSSCDMLSRSLTYLNAVISGSVHEFSEIMLHA